MDFIVLQWEAIKARYYQSLQDSGTFAHARVLVAIRREKLGAPYDSVCLTTFSPRSPHQGLVPDAIPVAHVGHVHGIPRHVRGRPATDAQPTTVRTEFSDDRVQPRHGGAIAAYVLGGIHGHTYSQIAREKACRDVGQDGKDYARILLKPRHM